VGAAECRQRTDRLMDREFDRNGGNDRWEKRPGIEKEEIEISPIFAEMTEETEMAEETLIGEAVEMAVGMVAGMVEERGMVEETGYFG